MSLIFWIIFIVLFLIIITLVFYYKKLKESYTEYDLIKTLNIDQIDETCFNYLKYVKKWSPDTFTDKEKKVLLTMRRLASTTYTDTTTSYPISKDAAVIPIEHLPVYNKIWDEQPWDLINPIPIPGSDAYLRPTYANEMPKGYVYEFNNRTKSNLANFLDAANLLYDSDFYEQLGELNLQLSNLTLQKNTLQSQFNYLTQQNTMYITLYNDMLAPNSDCKKNFNTMNSLSNQLYLMSVEAGNMTMNLQDLNNALNANLAQIQNLQTYYYTYTSNPIPPDMSYITNSNQICLQQALASCDANTGAWNNMNALV